MSNLAEKSSVEWVVVGDAARVRKGLGVGALVAGRQVAIFRLADGSLYAIDNYCPFAEANVISRGLVGDLKGHKVVASPVYKQHYDLLTGQCLEDESIKLATYPVREANGKVEVAA